jgi:hypothetical protein
MFDWIRENTLVKRSVSGLAVTFIGILILSLTFISCDGGGSSGDGGSREIPIFSPAVFMADKDVAGTVELYASFDDGDDNIKLSGSLVSGGEVVDFQVSPNGIFVAYVANQDNIQKFELYVVPVDKADDETAVKVSGSMAGSGIKEISLGSEEYYFAWAPNSTRIAYIADQDTAGVFELFTSTPDGSDNVQVSGALVSGGDVQDFEWEPAITVIAYVADQDTDDVQELYVSPADGDTPNDLVSGASMAGSGIKLISDGKYAFSWAPDNEWIAYIADQDTQDKFELYTSESKLKNDNFKVSAILGDNSDVDQFAWAPKNTPSKKIAYLVNDDNSDVTELFTTLPSVLDSLLISTGLALGKKVIIFEWAPTLARIAFIADKTTLKLFQLWTSSPNNSNNVLVSGDFLSNSDVIAFKWAPDSSRIAFIADDLEDEVFELFTTIPQVFPVPNPIVKISGDLTQFGNDGDVFDFKWAPDSALIAYTANQETADKIELFSSPPDGSAGSVKVSATSMAGTGIADSGTAFDWEPDSSGIGYIADQNTATVDELFASLSDGDENTRLSGTLVSGGDVFSFQWVP